MKPRFRNLLTVSIRGDRRPALLPKRFRNSDRINALGLPPVGLVAGVMQFLVIRRAERYGELIETLRPMAFGGAKVR